MRVYQKSIEAAKVFELDTTVIPNVPNGGKPYTYLDLLKDLRADKIKALQQGTRTPLFPSPVQEEENKNAFLADVERDQNFERMLTQLRQDVADEKRRKAEEAEKQREAAHQQTMAEYAAEVAWHQFRELRRTPGDSSPGFKVVHNLGGGIEEEIEYRFTSSADMEEAKMALLFADLCQGEYNLQNEGHLAPVLDAIKRRWNEPVFRSKLELSVTSGPEEECLRYIRDNLNPPASLRSLNKLRSRFWKDWQREAIRHLDEAEREERQRQEEQNRVQRDRGTGNRRNDGRELRCTDPDTRTGIVGCPAYGPNR